jgi:hypothetical protein
MADALDVRRSHWRGERLEQGLSAEELLKKIEG